MIAPRLHSRSGKLPRRDDMPVDGTSMTGRA